MDEDQKHSRDAAEFIRARIDILSAELLRLKTALEALEGKPKVYANIPIHEAVALFLEKIGRPADEQEIFEALMEGGANLGHREPLGQLRRSLTQSVNSKRLRTTKDGQYDLARN